MFVKDVDLEAMPTSIFLNDDDDDVRNPSLTLTVTFAFELSGYDYKLITGSSAVNGVPSKQATLFAKIMKKIQIYC